MASNAFTVEPAALQQLAQRLGALSTKLDQARSTTQRVDASAFGDPRLTHAAQEFVGHWTYQAERLGAQLDDFARRLDQAAGQYVQVEDAQLAAQGQRQTD